MTDLVGTCPKDFWLEWIGEGDAAGDPETGEEWGWFTEHSYRSLIKPGDRFYVVAWGRLRGYSIITSISGGAIVRRGNAVACTIPDDIPGFRGLRKRWWHRDCELPFPDWKTEGFGVKPIKAPKAKSNSDLFNKETPAAQGERAA